jgi:hypothetical protein
MSFKTEYPVIDVFLYFMKSAIIERTTLLEERLNVLKNFRFNFIQTWLELL